MAWNEPGGNNDNKDPWTGKNKSNTPPDLEEMLKNLYKKVLAALDNKKKEDGTPPEKPIKLGGVSIGLIIALLAVIWFFSGLFIVDPAEQAVILRFGKYVGTVGPGPHWIPRLIESAYKVNEQLIETYSYDAEMLTQDENIVSVAVAVQYRIANANDYLFNVVKPDLSLQQATASALRQVIGQTNLVQVLTSGRETIRQQVQQQLTNILSRYQTGLLITDVAIQPAKAPDEVKESFDDAIKAQEDEQRFENQAQSYAMQVIPIANGQAQRILANAKAYQQQIVLRAQGETSRFLALLPQFQKSPNVTKERLYLDMMQNVLSENNKVLADTNGNNMIYLPLDKLMQPAKPATITKSNAPPPTIAAATNSQSTDNSSSDTSSYGTTPKGGY